MENFTFYSPTFLPLEKTQRMTPGNMLSVLAEAKFLSIMAEVV